MDLRETKEALNKFAKEVIKQSRSNLTRKDKNYKKKLYDSLKSELDVFPNSFGLSFIMEEYGLYQDKGVSGTEKKYNTKFSYKSTSNLTGFEAKTGTFAKWAKFRGFRLRNKKGQFSKGDYKTIGFILANSIKKKGIKPSLFFTRPFENAFKNLPEELLIKFGLDVERFIDFTLKK